MKQKAVSFFHWFSLFLFIATALTFIATCFFIISPLQDQCANLESITQKLQTQVDGLTPKDTAAPNDYEKTLSFLKEEIQAYRSHIEQQEQLIIWAVGIALALFGAVVGFFSFKRKKDIQDSVQEEVQESIKKQIASSIGDNQELDYVSNSVKREKQAHQKRILFAIGEGENQASLTEVCEHFRNEGFNVVKPIQVLNEQNAKTAFNESNYDILVFQVPASEKRPQPSKQPTAGQGNPNPKTTWLFNILSDTFSKPGIFYCPGFEIDRDKFQQNIYTTVQYVPKLKETLYAMLYYGS